jgi:hypothetical protein
MTLEQLIPIILPLLALQLILIVIALRDLLRPDRHVRGGRKWAWGVVIVLGELLGPLIYLAVGRLEE